MKWKRICYIAIVAIIATIVLLPSQPIQRVISGSIIKPLYKKTIVIDPGHGGIDGGTYYGDILEKHLNLEMGTILREKLTKRGARVVMTREIDGSLEGESTGGSRHRRDLNTRVNIINESEADIFISLHANYTKNAKKVGPIVFYCTDSEEGKVLAKYIQDNLNKLSTYKKLDITPNHDITAGEYYILKHTNSPGVIVETGFISNEIDRKLLLEKEHQEEIAELITRAIIHYFLEDY